MTNHSDDSFQGTAFSSPERDIWGQPRDIIPVQDRGAAALAHGASLIAFVVSVGWLSFVGPLVMWLLWKDRSPYVREAAAGAFNFNLWANILFIIGEVLTFTWILAPVGIPLMIVVGFLMVWTHLRGVTRALGGKAYLYKHQLRILN